MRIYRAPSWTMYRVASASVEFTTDMQVADVDGDGDLDIVAADGSSTNNLIWFENPRPSGNPFAAWTRRTIGTHGDWVHDIEVADFDRDGRLDVLTRKTRTNIFFQNAGGTWTKRDITSFAVGWEGMGIGDIDRDGDVDIVTMGEWIETPSSPRTASFVRHTISSGWASDSTGVVGDINGDGRPDVVFANQHSRSKLAWYEGPANPITGVWIEHVLDTSMGSHKLNLGDLNRDGRLDVVAGLELAELAIYVQQPGGSFTKQTLSTQGIHNQRIGDIGNDGDLDIFGANYLGNPPVVLWQNTTSPSEADTTPPSTPANLTATAISPSQIRLSWSASTDNVAVTGYRVYRGGVLIASPSTTSHTDTGLNASTRYSYRVSAVDAAGNESSQSSQASATTPSVDATPPAISQVNATNITPSSATISWTTNETSTTQVDYGTTTSYGQSTALNGTMVTAHSANLSNLTPNTLYHFRVKSRDQAGNLAVSGDFTFSTTGSAPSPGGILAHWRLDEASGSTAADSAGGYNGTLQNGPVWTAGSNGGGLLFDGINDYVAVPSFDVSGNAITIATWIKFSRMPSGVDQRFVSKATNTSEQGHYWMIGQIGNRLRFRLKAGGSTSTLIAGSGNMNLNSWYHVAAVYDGSSMRLYLNGVLVGSIAKSGTIAQGPGVALNLGRNPDGSNHFSGTLDDVRLYNRALSASEITALMQNP